MAPFAPDSSQPVCQFVREFLGSCAPVPFRPFSRPQNLLGR